MRLQKWRMQHIDKKHKTIKRIIYRCQDVLYYQTSRQESKKALKADVKVTVILWQHLKNRQDYVVLSERLPFLESVVCQYESVEKNNFKEKKRS